VKELCATIALVLLSAAAVAPQSGPGLDPARLVNPGTDSWPTYNGDYSGRRYSTLAHIDVTNVKALSLAWMRPLSGPVQTIKATPLMINGVLYISTQDNAYAMDARTGRELWHYTWTSQGGNHLSNRGIICRTAAWPRSAIPCISKRPIATWSRSTSATASSAGTRRFAT
jgi:alcohol dehydrogenase (cytochrome c)